MYMDKYQMIRSYGAYLNAEVVARISKKRLAQLTRRMQRRMRG